MGVSEGIEAEEFFIYILSREGITVKRSSNTWYDFDLEYNGRTSRVEVKSTKVFRKDKKNLFRSGRFDFTREDNRKLAYQEDIMLCFIINFENQYKILGFQKTKKIFSKKPSRYVGVFQCLNKGMIPLDAFKEELSRGESIGQ